MGFQSTKSEVGGTQLLLLDCSATCLFVTDQYGLATGLGLHRDGDCRGVLDAC